MSPIDRLRSISRNAFIGLNAVIFVVLVGLATPSVSPVLISPPDNLPRSDLAPMNQPDIDHLAATQAAQSFAEEEWLRTLLRGLPAVHLLSIGLLMAFKTRRTTHAN